MQSQVKPSHCCKQTPWLAQDSSVQVVLGPGRAGGRNGPSSAQPLPSQEAGEREPGPEALPSVLPGQKVGRGGGGLKDCWAWP